MLAPGDVNFLIPATCRCGTCRLAGVIKDPKVGDCAGLWEWVLTRVFIGGGSEQEREARAGRRGEGPGASLMAVQRKAGPPARDACGF